MGSETEPDQENPTCKSCKDPIEGDVVMLHGRFPMHGDCYRRTVEPDTGRGDSDGE